MKWYFLYLGIQGKLYTVSYEGGIWAKGIVMLLPEVIKLELKVTQNKMFYHEYTSRAST